MAYSARSIVRNPITGEEIDYSNTNANTRQNTQINLHNNRTSTAPKSNNSTQTLTNHTTTIPVQSNKDLNDVHKNSNVPLLNLENLSNRDKQDAIKKNPIITAAQRADSARPKSSYRRGFEQQPLDSPILNYQKVLDEKNDKTPIESEKSQLEAPRVPKPEKKKEVFHIERIEDLQKLWLHTQNDKVNSKNAHDIEENLEKNKHLKEQLVLDTVMTDQLSRFVLSEPAQEAERRITSRRMHNTVINPKGSSTETTLNKRIKFNCRMRTPDGKNALRELFGILFLHDGSLTVYEFRQLCGAYFTGIGSGNVSKKANALPFIARKIYTHAYGRRKGKRIDLVDIYKGAVLYIPASINEHSNKYSQDYFEIEVTEVDENEKEKLISNDSNANELRENLKNPLSETEINDVKIVNSVRSFFRKQIETRSIKVFTGLGKELRKLSEKTNGFVDIKQFHSLLHEYNLQIHEDDLNIVWQVLDSENSGYLQYYKLLRAYLGEMNDVRHNYFRDLMHKLDPQKSGYVQVSDVYKFYKAQQHPTVKSGRFSEKDIFEQFLNLFEYSTPYSSETYRASMQKNLDSALISYEQFEEYYNGLSLIIDTDQDFMNILKNSWSLL